MSFPRLPTRTGRLLGGRVRSRLCGLAGCAVRVPREVPGQLVDRDEVQVRERAPALVEAEAVAGEELVGDGEADVVERDVVDEPTVRPVEQRHGRQARRIPER